MMRHTRFPILLAILLPLAVLAQPVKAAPEDAFLKRATTLYLVHEFEGMHEPEATASPTDPIKGLPLAHDEKFRSLSRFPIQTVLKPVDDIETTIRRIELLTEELERLEGSEQSQRTRFALAVEYFRIYLYYLKQKYGFLPEENPAALTGGDSPVSEAELVEYLSWADYHVKTLISPPGMAKEDRNTKELITKDSQTFQLADDISFRLHKDENLYISAYYLAFLIECERMAAEWPPLSENLSRNRKWHWKDGYWQHSIDTYNQKTWFWLDGLWQRYKTGKTSQNPSAARQHQQSFVPDLTNLFSLYELYFRYHLVSRLIGRFQKSSPVSDTMTISILKRLAQMQEAGGFAPKGYYSYYLKEARKDAGHTGFFPALFFAHKGYAITEQDGFRVPRNTLFRIYLHLFNQAAASVRYNISYRADVFNELILFGVKFRNLEIMETILLPYADRSVQIASMGNISSEKIGQSSELTSAYLLAHILDLKRISGLDHDTDKYRGRAEALLPSLTVPANENWVYAAAIHRAMAAHYGRKQETGSEALAMYHARMALLAPCRMVTETFGTKEWKRFFTLPEQNNPQSLVALFLYFHNKYPTSEFAQLPTEYQADKIIHETIRRTAVSE